MTDQPIRLVFVFFFCGIFFPARIVVWNKSNRSGKHSSWRSALLISSCQGETADWWQHLSRSSRSIFCFIAAHISFDKTLRSSPHLHSLLVFFFLSPKKNKKTKKQENIPSICGRENIWTKITFFFFLPPKPSPLSVSTESEKCFQKVARVASAFYALTAICGTVAGCRFFVFFLSMHEELWSRCCLLSLLHSEAMKQSRNPK